MSGCNAETFTCKECEFYNLTNGICLLHIKSYQKGRIYERKKIMDILEKNSDVCAALFAINKYLNSEVVKMENKDEN